MKKIKILSIVLCLMLVFSVAACSGGDPAPLFDDTLPWTEKGNACTETMTYSFARYLTDVTVNPDFVLEGEDIEKGYKLTDSSTLTYKLEEGASVEMVDGQPVRIKNDNTSGHTLVTMVLEVNYKSDLDLVPNVAARNLYAGKTDTMKSFTVMNRYSLESLFTYKWTDIQTQAEIDTYSYTLTADYKGDITGSRKATLVERTAAGRTNTKTMNIKKGSYYDSESIYFQIRAMRTIKPESSKEFSMALPYNDLLEGKGTLGGRGMIQSTQKSTVKIDIGDNLLKLFDVPEITSQNPDEGEEEEKGLDCLWTAFRLNTDKSGPSINLYYSSYPTKKDGNIHVLYPTSKVLVGIEYPNHDQGTNAIYIQEYTLTQYSNSNIKGL